AGGLSPGARRHRVVSVRVARATGEVATDARHPRRPLPPTTTITAQASARLNDIVTSLATLLEQNAALITAHRPRTRFNHCGYLLHDVLTEDQIDLARLLVGSEGTL